MAGIGLSKSVENSGFEILGQTRVPGFRADRRGVLD